MSGWIRDPEWACYVNHGLRLVADDNELVVSPAGIEATLKEVEKDAGRDPSESQHRHDYERWYSDAEGQQASNR